MLRSLAERQEKLKAAKMAKLKERMNELSGNTTPILGQDQMSMGGRIKYETGGRVAKGFTLPTGLDASNIGNFQRFAQQQGADLGKYGVDNIFGTNTQNAWNTYGQSYLDSLGTSTQPLTVPNADSYNRDYRAAMEASANQQANLDALAKGNLDSYNQEYNRIMNADKAANDLLAQEQHVNNRNAMIGAGSLLNSAGDIYGLVQGIRGPEEINLDRLNPDLINLARQREIARRQGASTQAIQRENIRNNATSSGAALSSMVAGTAAIDQNLANILSQSALDEEVRNTGILNAAQQANQQIDTQEQMLNLQAQAKSQEAIQAGLSGIGANAAQGLKDVRQSNAVDIRNEQQLNSMNAILQNFMIGKNGEITFKNGDPASQEDIQKALEGKTGKNK